ncbi:MAG: LysE family translocator [Pseudomonadota bacterium]
MTLEQFLAFNAILLAALLTPGPAMLAMLHTAMSDGRRAGLALGLGLATMACAWLLAAALGLQAIFAAFPWAYSTMKVAGALYLLYFAWKTWGRNDHTDPYTNERDPGAVRNAHAGAFLSGIFINSLNPKSVLFAGAVLVVVFPAGISMGQGAFLVANQMVVEAAFYSAAVLLVSRPVIMRRYVAARKTFDRICSLVLGAFGLKLLLSRAD